MSDRILCHSLNIFQVSSLYLLRSLISSIVSAIHFLLFHSCSFLAAAFLKAFIFVLYSDIALRSHSLAMILDISISSSTGISSDSQLLMNMLDNHAHLCHLFLYTLFNKLSA